MSTVTFVYVYISITLNYLKSKSSLNGNILVLLFFNGFFIVFCNPLANIIIIIIY